MFLTPIRLFLKGKSKPKVQRRLFAKRYNRGSTHAEHGGVLSKKGMYTQQAFKQHNELKLLNSLQGKYQNDAQRREFETGNKLETKPDCSLPVLKRVSKYAKKFYLW